MDNPTRPKHVVVPSSKLIDSANNSDLLPSQKIIIAHAQNSAQANNIKDHHIGDTSTSGKTPIARDSMKLPDSA